MNDPNHSIFFLSAKNSPINFAVKQESQPVSQIMPARRFSFSSGSDRKPKNISFSSTRCAEKGCVFPASSQGDGKCTYHRRQEEEPVLFRSHQPTGLFLDPARSLPTESEESGSRKRDRRRMAAIWEQFQNDGTSCPDDPALK